VSDVAAGPPLPAIGSSDDLRAALFGAEESVTEFDHTIRRWREEPESV
jgi:hypothetical protein